MASLPDASGMYGRRVAPASYAADRRAAAVADRWHWHLEILPRVNQLAGFELGTGCHITPLPAAEAAARLRDA